MILRVRDVYKRQVLQYTPQGGRPVNHQRLAAIRNRQWKLALPERSQPQLFDLLGDVSESRDCAAQHPAVALSLQSEAERFDKALRGQLRPLGTL